MKIHILGLTLATLVASSAFAQDNNTTSQMKRPQDSSQKGIFVGAEYINITDMNIEITAKSKNGFGSNSDKSSGGGHLGMAGVRLGYSQTPTVGAGFNAGLTVLTGINKSEYGDDNVTAYLPQGNFTFGFNKMLMAYIGPNIAILRSSSSFNDIYKPDIGGQIGLGLRLSKNLSLAAGSTLIRQKIEIDDSDVSATGELQLSGFTSNLTYTF